MGGDNQCVRDTTRETDANSRARAAYRSSDDLCVRSCCLGSLFCHGIFPAEREASNQLVNIRQYKYDAHLKPFLNRLDTSLR